MAQIQYSSVELKQVRPTELLIIISILFKMQHLRILVYRGFLQSSCDIYIILYFGWNREDTKWHKVVTETSTPFKHTVSLCFE